MTSETDYQNCKTDIERTYNRYGSAMVLMAISKVIPPEDLKVENNFYTTDQEIFEGENYV